MDYVAVLTEAVESHGFESAPTGNALSKLLDLIERAKQLIGVTPGDAEQIIAAALEVYDSVIAPLDLTGIALLEKLVDRGLRAGIERLLRSALT